MKLNFSFLIYLLLALNSLSAQADSLLIDSTSFSWVREIASQPDFYLRENLEEYRKDGINSEIKLVIDPFDYKGQIVLQFYLTVLKDINYVDFDLLYHFEKDPFSDSFPDSTLNEIKVQLSVKKNYPSLFYDYLLMRGDKILEPWEATASSVGIDSLIIQRDINSRYIERLVQENYSLSTQLKINYIDLMENWEPKTPFVNSNGYVFRPEVFFRYYKRYR